MKFQQRWCKELILAAIGDMIEPIQYKTQKLNLTAEASFVIKVLKREKTALIAEKKFLAMLRGV